VLPNDLEGMSVIAFSPPAMCRVVKGEAFVTCRRSAKALTSCIATADDFTASRCTQCTLGLLSLYRATCALARSPTMLSITRNSMRRAAISKSEFVKVPLGFASDLTARVMASGHW
jgi:hypothetical protein